MPTNSNLGAPIRGRVAYNSTHNRFEVLRAGEWLPAVECIRHGWAPRAPSMSSKKKWVCRFCQDAALKAADTTFLKRQRLLGPRRLDR